MVTPLQATTAQSATSVSSPKLSSYRWCGWERHRRRICYRAFNPYFVSVLKRHFVALEMVVTSLYGRPIIGECRRGTGSSLENRIVTRGRFTGNWTVYTADLASFQLWNMERLTLSLSSNNQVGVEMILVEEDKTAHNIAQHVTLPGSLFLLAKRISRFWPGIYLLSS